MSEEAFEILLARLNAGTPDAATEIFKLFSERLKGLARSRLSPRLRQKVDPDDIVQSVFRTFFRRQAEGRFEDEGKFVLENWEGLWGLLVTIAVRKCGRKAEHFYAGRRDVLREARLQPASDEDSRGGFELAVPEPTPDEAAALTELITRLMSQLSPRRQQVLELRLQGYSEEEISQRVGRVVRTVQRDLKEIQTVAESLWDGKA